MQVHGAGALTRRGDVLVTPVERGDPPNPAKHRRKSQRTDRQTQLTADHQRMTEHDQLRDKHMTANLGIIDVPHQVAYKLLARLREHLGNVAV